MKFETVRQGYNDLTEMRSGHRERLIHYRERSDRMPCSILLFILRIVLLSVSSGLAVL
jgi:hypothetical protein